MTAAIPMIEVWRGPFLESIHRGHAVVCNQSGDVVEAWGDPEQVILPRSSSKMIQALPLIESGAADAAGLTDRHLALACASHQGAAVHSDLVTEWMTGLGFTDGDLRCGTEFPRDQAAANALIRAEAGACQYHNNCSGKHVGFLMMARHLGAGPEYVTPDHPVQSGVKEAFESVTGLATPGYGIDGCSAPNFATTLHGLARAMALFASADPEGPSVRQKAAGRLVNAMRANPVLVAGEGRACTELMNAMPGRTVIKTGAEAVFIAILPDQKLGIALKIEDGTTRAAEAAIAALLVRHGVLDPSHPAALKRMNAPILNRRMMNTGVIRPVPGLF